METVWDWATVLLFAGLITLFLERSSAQNPQDKLWQYAPPAIACAVANYLGNNGLGVIAIALLAATGIYVVKVLRLKIGS